jgi:protein gp37
MTTKIEWTRGDDGMPGMTWNPTTGCDRISPGCDNCYALTMAKRLKAMGSAKYQTDGDPRTSGPGFGLAVHGDALTIPLRWREPRRVFVNSMSDLFHARVPRAFIAQVWLTMARTPQHEYQILTKRPARMVSVVGRPGDGGLRLLDALLSEPDALTLYEAVWPLPNVWLGTSIESDDYASRVDDLRQTDAEVRFVSAEPLLGPVPSLDLHGIDWLIIGGESGKGARPLELAWVSDLIERARDAKTAVFVKQLGSVWARDTSWSGLRVSSFSSKGGDPDYWPADLRIREYPSVPGGGA